MKDYKFLLKHEELIALTPGTVGCMAYNCILADTIRERGEAILCKITELANVITAKSGPGYMWLACSDMVYEHIRHAVKESNEELFEYGGKDIRFMGIIDRKIKVFVDPLLPTNVMYLGNRMVPNWSKEEICPKHYVRFTFSGMPGGEKDQWDLDPEYLCKIGVDRVA